MYLFNESQNSESDEDSIMDEKAINFESIQNEIQSELLTHLSDRSKNASNCQIKILIQKKLFLLKI